MGAGEGEQEQWSGGVHVVLECEVERAWALMADFTGLHNWNPMVKVCRLVEGVNRQPGCVRYCEGTRSESWVYERLLFIDEARHEMSYRMEKNRFRFQDGIRGYVARIQVSHKAFDSTSTCFERQLIARSNFFGLPNLFSHTNSLEEEILYIEFLSNVWSLRLDCSKSWVEVV